MKEINSQFRERFSIVHQKDRRDHYLTCPAGYIEIESDWCITIPADADKVLINAARDLEDYFFTSMGISPMLICEENIKKSKKSISYKLDSKIKENSYKIEVNENSVILTAPDSRMAAQAGYFLEDLMNIAEGPYLKPETLTRTSILNPRMVHSGYGLDMYPNEHLINIAHSGISSILVFIKGVDKTPHGYHDFNDLCRRAGEYGLDVYAYSYLENKMHPSDEGAEEFYDNLYGSFFERCPYFKGIIFVGESFEFPSKDEHTMMIRRLDNIGPDGKPIKPQTKPFPGWWPCYDYTELLLVVKKAIHKRCPDMDIVFWSYNWSRVSPEDRRALVDTLPKDITLQATFEGGETVERDGIKNRVTDYTVFFPGPGYYFKTESQFAKENGLKLYAMTNAGGLTWAVGVVPYIPAPYQWMERFRGIQRAHGELGLSGSMDSHHFGFSPSFISDLAKWAFHEPYEDLDEVLKKLAGRDFAPEYADRVIEAYKLFSEGSKNMISTIPDQYGPLRMGPSYPFVLFREKDVEIPTVPYAHFGGNKITYAVYGKNTNLGSYGVLANDEARKKFEYEIKCYKLADELYTKGASILEEIIPNIRKAKRDNALRILATAKFIRNTARTVVNIKEFHKLKDAIPRLCGNDLSEALDSLLVICKREIENAVDTIPLVEFDSRLGYEPSMEYMTDRAHIEWKIDELHRVISEEIPLLRK